MIPTLRTPCHRDGWAYEEKVDGWRILAYKDGQRVRLVKGVTHDGAVPRARRCDRPAGAGDSGARRRDRHLRRAAPLALRAAAPPRSRDRDGAAGADRVRRASLDGQDVAPRPLRERRQLLEDLVTGADMVYSARRLAPNGLEAWAQVLERGYEGLVAKDDGSSYRGKTTAWLKVRVAAPRTVPSLVGAMATGTAAR
jgi:bifunctional non-homologous end joining protein LigD